MNEKCPKCGVKGHSGPVCSVVHLHTGDKSGLEKVAQELGIKKKAERTLRSVSGSGRNLL